MLSRLKIFAPALAGLVAIGGIGPAAAAEFVAKTTIVPELKAVFGEVESRTVLPARARIGGTIQEIKVTEGTEVKQGDVVGRVTDEKLALQLDAANAKIKELKSSLDNAQTQYDRVQQLFARGVSSQSQIDQARTGYNVAVNQVAAAEADKSVIEQRAREGDILAPATGRVLTVPVLVGSVIMAGEPIARIASGGYFLRLLLPERHATEIKEGGTVLIAERGQSPSKSGTLATARHGRIIKIYPEITGGRVMADVDVAGLGDYFVNERTLVWIPVGKRQVIAVPPEAVTTLHGVDYVRLATKDGPLDVAVILGETFPDDNGPKVEILTGLHDGDRVILPGNAK